MNAPAPAPRCPECNEFPRLSLGGTVTLVFYHPFFDDQGREHKHDNNARSSEYECPEGHRYSAANPHTCWCGWIQGRDDIEWDGKPKPECSHEDCEVTEDGAHICKECREITGFS